MRADLTSPLPGIASNSGSRLYLGPNFSGRSAQLMEAVKKAGSRGFFIGPEIISSFSGFAATVEKELDYFSECLKTRTRSLAFLDSVGMNYILSRNPFTLSGGEQTLAAFASAIAYGGNVLAADCCIEQLDRNIRSLIFDRLREFCPAVFVGADNRADEHSIPESLQQYHLSPTQATVDSMLDHSLLPERHFTSEPLTLEKVVARYNSQSDFVLSVPRLFLDPGKIYRLTGPNGAGKTTLCRVLVGLLRVASGTIYVGSNKADFWKNPGKVASLSFQNPDHQLFSETVEAEFMSRQYPPGLIASTMRAFGIATSHLFHPGSLPFVLRKRLALAVAFAASRGWYILDEPTIGQDNKSIEELALVIKRFSSLGCGVIIITHSERFSQLLDAHTIALKGGVCASD
jgi:energy-coupling factor transporter ATP-binding protein EcfA2